MSYQAVDRVYKHSTSSGSARQVLLYLAHRAGVDGTDARPSLDEIEAATGLSRKTIISAVASLETDGELAVERGRGRAQRTRYDVLVKAPEKVESDPIKVEPEYTLNEANKVEPDSTLNGHDKKVESDANSTLNGGFKVEPDSTANTRTLNTNPVVVVVDADAGAGAGEDGPWWKDAEEREMYGPELARLLTVYRTPQSIAELYRFKVLGGRLGGGLPTEWLTAIAHRLPWPDMVLCFMYAQHWDSSPQKFLAAIIDRRARLIEAARTGPARVEGRIAPKSADVPANVRPLRPSGAAPTRAERHISPELAARFSR